MSWKGRIWGAIIGIFFSPLGALIGFAIGYFFFDKPKNEMYQKMVNARNTFTGSAGDSLLREQIIISTFRLMGYVSRGAGRINEQQIQQATYIMDTMNLNSQQREIAKKAFSLGKSDKFDLQREVYSLRGMPGIDEALIASLLEIQVAIAIADFELSAEEHRRLLEIASLFGFNTNAMERLIKERVLAQQFARFANEYARRQQQGGGSYQYNNYNEQGQTEQQPIPKNEIAAAYEILGVTEDTPWEEIRTTYKKLMLKYHPDRLASQGLTPEMIKIYTQKAQDIQSAFNLIKEYLGK